MTKLPDRPASKRASFGKLFLIYTGIFVVLAFGVYFLFIINDRTLLRYDFSNKDAVAQRYMFIFEFRRFLENLFSGGGLNTWDWTIGLGADGYAFNSANLWNPFSYITAFAPAKYADLVYSLTVVLRVWLSGVTYMLFARKIGHTDWQTLLGAVCYSFSPWIIICSLTQGSFLMASFLLPLVLLGVEKILLRESPLPFILSVGYTVLVTFTFAYMIGILTVLYFFVRWLTAYSGKGIRNFGNVFGALITCGISGIMLSGIGLYVTLLRYTESTASTAKEALLFFSRDQYLRAPMRLVNWTSIFGSSSYIGLTAVCVLMIPLIILLFFKRRSNAWMTGLLFVLAFLPKADSLFNFLSYPSGRWMFALAFFFTLAAMECLDEELLAKKSSRILLTLFFLAYSGYLAWILKVSRADARPVALFNWAVMAVLLVLLLIHFRGGREEASGPRSSVTEALSRSRFFSRSVLAITMIALIGCYTLVASPMWDGYLKNGEAEEMLAASAQKAGTVIEDSDFYRVDQVDEITGMRKLHCKMNEAMYFGNRSNYVFTSSVDVDWLRFNKLVGNSQGYYKRVAPNSNDNRFGLDLLMGTRYFLSDKKNTAKPGTGFANFGFAPFDETENALILKNDYFIGAGAVFTRYMYESEWLKLSYPERELALLEAAVLPDGAAAPSGLTELRASDVDHGVRQVPYQEEIDGNVHHISCENDDQHQLMMTLTNCGASIDGTLLIYVDSDKIEKTIANTEGDERGFADIEDLTINLGTGPDAARNLQVDFHLDESIRKKAEVRYDDLILWSVPVDAYTSSAEVLETRRLVTEEISGSRLSGTVTTDEAGLLFLSVPSSDGWEIYIDGEKAEAVTPVDICFTGVSMPAGTHKVELRYHTTALLPGAAISLLGLLFTAFILIFYRRRGSASRKAEKALRKEEPGA